MTITLPISWIPREKRIDHSERRRMRLSPARVKFAKGGRRSGKSTDGMDYLLLGHGPIDANGMPLFRGALCPPASVVDPNYLIAAPTFAMVKRIWWSRLKNRLPSHLLDHRPNETELSLVLANGARITCMGMDRPTRSEGDPIDGLIGDEYAYWREGAYQQSLRPAMSTRGRPPGWAILLFKPCGENHATESWDNAKAGKRAGQDAFGWRSDVIVSPEELAAARAELDPRTYEQEYGAEVLQKTGLVYYRWSRALHVRPLAYNPALPLIFSFDFNVAPGSAVVCQEQQLMPLGMPEDGPNKLRVATTCVLNEVFVEDDSNTPMVCEKLRAMYPEHRGPVLLYGDVGGHQRRTSARSTDWEVIEEELGKTYRDVRLRVGRSAPGVVDSVAAVNSRLCTSSGVVRVAVDARTCEQTVRDFGGVVWDDRKEDREIDKRNKKRTHWTDALRYYVAEEFPIGASGSYQEY